MEEFGKLLRYKREQVGLSQQTLAKQIGTDDSYLSRIERGIYAPPSRDKVLAILDALEITDKQERYYFLLAANCASLQDVDFKSGKDKNFAEQNGHEQKEGSSGYKSPLSIPRQRILINLLMAIENNLHEAIEGIRELRELMIEVLGEENE